MQLPTPTQQEPTQQEPIELHPLGPQDPSSPPGHNGDPQPLPVTPINSLFREPSQPECDARPIPQPLGPPFRHSPQARVDLSKVGLKGTSAQSSRRHGRTQTPPRQPQEARKADVVSG